MEFDKSESEFANIKYGYGELNRLNAESMLFKLNPEKVTQMRFKKLMNITGKLH
tara:strand:- start:8765 stop:8926 length:162 start_codon:yes stop_codon:yes gene_type:complete